MESSKNENEWAAAAVRALLVKLLALVRSGIKL